MFSILGVCFDKSVGEGTGDAGELVMGGFVEIGLCVWQPVFNRIFFQLLTINCDYRDEQTDPGKHKRA